MAIVYVWFGGDLKKGFIDNLGNVGHVSLQYGSKPTEYISFYPADEKGKKTQSWSVPSRFSPTYKTDCIDENERKADLKIELNGINRALIEAFLFKLKSSTEEDREYNLRTRNCASVVSEALIVGYRLRTNLKAERINWLDNVPLKFLSGSYNMLTVDSYLSEQINRIFRIRTSQGLSINISKSLMSVFSLSDSRLRKNLYYYMKYHDCIWWSPLHVSYFALNLEKYFNK